MAFEPETPPAVWASEQNKKEFYLRQEKLAKLKAEAEKPPEPVEETATEERG